MGINFQKSETECCLQAYLGESENAASMHMWKYIKVHYLLKQEKHWMTDSHL